MAKPPGLLQCPPAGYDPEQNHYDGNDEEDMNEPVDRGPGYQAQCPQNEQYDGNGV